MNFNNYLFRCSALPTIMTNGRGKGEGLSETAKTYLEELWIKEVYGREKYDTKSKYTDKGIQCESDSLDLIQRVEGKTYFKNKQELSNDFIKGTPDVISPLIDIKTSWDLWTFLKVDSDYAYKTYYYQLLGYGWLKGVSTGQISFCLVNTPEEIINDELYKLSFRHPEINESDEKAEKYRRNYIFDDIDEKIRIKTYTFDLLETDIELVKQRLSIARSYLNEIKL